MPEAPSAKQALESLLNHLNRDIQVAKTLRDWKSIEDRCVQAYLLAAKVTDEERQA